MLFASPHKTNQTLKHKTLKTLKIKNSIGFSLKHVENLFLFDRSSKRDHDPAHVIQQINTELITRLSSYFLPWHNLTFGCFSSYKLR